MVFEHLFPNSLLERKHWTAFFLAAIYSTISILIARLIFPANSGIVSVIFLSIFLVPYFRKLLRREEMSELSDKGMSLRKLIFHNKDMIKVYVFIFLGVYTTYMLYSFLAPMLGFDVSIVFREQLSLDSLRGGAAFSFTTFASIFLNNWWVLLACFLIALIAGDGAIFFVAWNASTWGTIFGYRAMAASSVDGSSALLTLLAIVLITLPHVIIEGGAYILAAIAGGVISDEIDSRNELRTFVLYFIGALVVYVVVYLIARMFLPVGIVLGLFTIIFALLLLYAMQYVLDNARDKLIFKYNFLLFLLAIGVFILGAIIETYVLGNSSMLNNIYFAASGYA